MPKMVSLRDFRLASLSGHVVVFEARTPRDVPAAAVEDALAAGCAMVNPNETPDFDDMTRQKFDLESDLRQSVIYLVCADLVEKNRPVDFDGGGMPREGVVSNILNFEVGKKELADVWQAYLTAKSEGRVYGVHESAADVLRIIQAENKNDLLEIAADLEIDLDQFDGKQTKTIRTALLKTFRGAILV